MPNTNLADVFNLMSLSKEERIQRALTAIARYSEQGVIYSIRQAAKDYNVARSTLQDRYNGVSTRTEAHAYQQNLSSAQEEILVAWIKAQARRGIPLSHTAVSDHASDIAGKPMGVSWIHNFKRRHPDLCVRWTSSLEECRARALTPQTVAGFYDLLEDVLQKTNSPPENIYNPDEKGIQLGVGKRTQVLVDRDQKVVQSTEHGNRDLITIIECVCADVTTLPPSIIFEGARINPEWGRVNPANASISVSPNGWTDTELGYLWLIKDFGPTSAARNKSGQPVILILDGHNSHCSYKFVSWAEKNGIEILCLPAHTTHALQPCDVGVFSPLAAKWKALVTKLNRNFIQIDKYNLLEHYATARAEAFKETTILAAFHKTGIHPFDRNAIPSMAYEPAKNFSTESMPPVPIQLPSLLTPVSETSSATSQSTTFTTTSESTSKSVVPKYHIVLPPKVRNASRVYLEGENENLRKIAVAAGQMLEANHAQLKLMETELVRYQRKAFAKKKTWTALNTGAARHLTSRETLDLLAHNELQKHVAAMIKELKPTFKTIKKRLAAAEKAKKVAEKRAIVAARKAKQKAEREVAAAAKRLENRGQRRGRGRGRGRGITATGQGYWNAEAAETSSGESFDSISSSSDNGEYEVEQRYQTGGEEDRQNEISLPEITEIIPTGGEEDRQNEISLPEITEIIPPLPTNPPRPRPRPRPHSHPIVPNVTTTGETPGTPSIVFSTTDGATQIVSSGSERPASVLDNGGASEEETVIKSIWGHKWVGKGLLFEVLWEDGDIIWEKRANLEDCAALDEYLGVHGITDPSKLSKSRFSRQV